MQNNILYFHKDVKKEFIYYQNSTKSYPVHTHANHLIIGHILEGAVCIVCEGQEYIYHANEHFCILPDVAHAVGPVNNAPYSMICICVPDDGLMSGWMDQSCYIKKLKEMILNAPENAMCLKDIAKDLGVSPYHMIRQFKDVCGLTPHQFRIQCRVRKAQRLLEEGKSAIEVVFVAGFYDQSHFDRCFRKIVGLTPHEYKRSVTMLA